MIISSKSDIEIASIFYICAATICVHIKNIFENLNINSRIEISNRFSFRLMQDILELYINDLSISKTRKWGGTL